MDRRQLDTPRQGASTTYDSNQVRGRSRSASFKPANRKRLDGPRKDSALHDQIMTAFTKINDVYYVVKGDRKIINQSTARAVFQEVLNIVQRAGAVGISVGATYGGAAVGTALGPGVGTLAGGAIGSLGGIATNFVTEKALYKPTKPRLSQADALDKLGKNVKKGAIKKAGYFVADKAIDQVAGNLVPGVSSMVDLGKQFKSARFKNVAAKRKEDARVVQKNMSTVKAFLEQNYNTGKQAFDQLERKNNRNTKLSFLAGTLKNTWDTERTPEINKESLLRTAKGKPITRDYFRDRYYKTMEQVAKLERTLNEKLKDETKPSSSGLRGLETSV